MAFDLMIGSLTNYIPFLYSTGIENENGDQLPCVILELSESETQSIPVSPQDTNSYVGDTIYRNPLQIQVMVFVKGNNITNFEEDLERFQLSQRGFIIHGVYKSYTNLRFIEKNYSENSNRVGGSVYNLTFQEVLFLQSFSSEMTLDQVKNPQDSSPVNGGNKISKKSSTLFKGLNNGF